MAAIPISGLPDNTPAPLEFLKTDFIHPDNAKVVDREKNLWRLLSPIERLRMQRQTDALARQLRKAQYNQLVLQLDTLRKEVRHKKAIYRAATDRAEKVQLHKELQLLFDTAKPIGKQLAILKPTYEAYKHFQGWLDYERQHRKELKEEKKRKARIEREMNREAKWLQQLIVSVWKQTPGCHHTYHESDDKKRITKAPKIAHSIIRPDAHYFYVLASKKVLLGWRWMLPHGVMIHRLMEEDVIENLAAATKRQVSAEISETGQLMIRVSRLDSPDALPREVPWKKAIEYYPEKDNHKLPYCIGVKEARKYVWLDFATDPHILVAGKTQSGKSNLVNGIIGTLVSTHSPSELRLVLIDQKGGIEFTHWWGLPHLYGPVIKTVEEVEPALDNIVKIMKSREKLLTSVKAKTIADYNKKVDTDAQLPRILIILDEMINLVGHGELTKRIHIKMAQVTGLGRATGIHMIASTQHPEVKVIPSMIKTNMSIRMSGSMPNHKASELILDTADAARLPSIPGRFIAVRGLDKWTLQVPRIMDDDIEGIISSTKLAYPDVPEHLQDEQSHTPLTVWNAQRCLGYSIDYLDGALSAQKLHNLLGGDSIGEWEFKKIYKAMIDSVWSEGQKSGVLIRESDGTQWTVKKVKRAYFLVAYEGQTDKPDETKAPEMVESAAD